MHHHPSLKEVSVAVVVAVKKFTELIIKPSIKKLNKCFITSNFITTLICYCKTMNKQPTALIRKLNLPLFIFYGVGSILGAGIYALIGKVAGEAGMHTPFSFVLASILAGLTGFSYAELASRYPQSGGEAMFINRIFNSRAISLIIGVLAMSSATVSAATLANAFTGYLQVFIPFPSWLAILIIVLAALAIALWGIEQSAIATGIFTLIEIGGLLMIIWVCRSAFGDLPERALELVPSFENITWMNILHGSFLAFYAFIGFEDMANVAEEVKKPKITIPLGIIIAITLSTALYFAVSLVSVLSLDPSILDQSDAALATLYEENTGSSPLVITFIGLFAIVNGLLVQIVVGSRMLFGLSREKCLPSFFSYVLPKRKTPGTATLTIASIVLLLAWFLPLVGLAKTTSFIILLVFCVVNLACIVIKIKKPQADNAWTAPIIIPIAGFLSTTAFLGWKIIMMITNWL